MNKAQLQLDEDAKLKHAQQYHKMRQKLEQLSLPQNETSEMPQLHCKQYLQKQQQLKTQKERNPISTTHEER